MTPEEAKPHVFRYASTQGQPGDVQLEKETGERIPIGTPFFTAKETAEIARAYAESTGKYINAVSKDMEREADAEMSAWENNFEEWSK